jgi:hypothetical protein
MPVELNHVAELRAALEAVVDPVNVHALEWKSKDASSLGLSSR